jgi:biopolymer transport protein ExbD
MAQLEGGGDDGHKKGPGVKKAKKLSTRVDMTPMVDLGFLLITFFIFTTTMSSPKALNLNMPKDTQDSTQLNKVAQSGALTILLGKGNVVYYYEGQLENNASNFKTSTFTLIRDVIIKKRKAVIAAYTGDPKCEEKAKKEGKPVSDCADENFVVVIKPDQDATYKNTVDILDEMTINNVKRYAMVDILPVEYQLIQATEKSTGIK